MENLRWVALAMLILFSAYTVHISFRESFFKSLKKILGFRWGKQIFTDLVIGVILFHVIIYLNEGSLLVTLAWFAASVIFGNIATLIYFILNFHSLIAHF